MKNGMKLCKDCKHYQFSMMDFVSPRCMRTRYIDPVSGQIMYHSCEVERMSYTKDSCGPEAHYWESANG